MDYTDLIDQAAANVLSNHEILMASPASAKLNSFYPTPAESTSTIAQAVNNSGQLFIQSNSKRIGGSADFLVSTPNIMDVPQLNLSMKIGAYTGAGDAANAYMCTFQDGWGFDLIERIEVSFAKSNISNLQLQGHALKDWSLLQCKNEDERKEMMKIAGKAQTWSINQSRTLSASIPLSFLFFRSAGGVEGGFPIDGRALHGPITFQIHFHTINYAVGPAASIYNRSGFPVGIDGGSGDINSDTNASSFPSSIIPANAGILPDSFETLELTMRTYQLMDGVFSVAKALESNPILKYSIPSLWLNTYSQQVKLDANGRGTLNINSIPAGMLQAIIVRARPVNPQGYANYSYSTTAAMAADATFTGDKNSLLNYNAPPLDGSAIRPKRTLTDAVAGYEAGVTPSFTPYRGFSLPFTELQLDYSGQSIFRAKTKESYDAFMRDVFNDDLKTKIRGMPQHLSVIDHVNLPGADSIFNTSVRNIGDDALVDLNTQVVVIPLCHNGNQVFRQRAFENLPHYSGSTLQLQFQVAPYNTFSSDGSSRNLCFDNGTVNGTPSNETYNPTSGTPIDRWNVGHPPSSETEIPLTRQQHVCFATGPNKLPGKGQEKFKERVIMNNRPDDVGATAYDANGGLVELNLTYVISSLFQITGGTAEMQL